MYEKQIIYLNEFSQDVSILKRYSVSLLYHITIIKLLFCTKKLHFFFLLSRMKYNIVHLFLNKLCFCYECIAITTRNKSLNIPPHVSATHVLTAELSESGVKAFTNIKRMKIWSLKGSHQF